MASKDAYYIIYRTEMSEYTTDIPTSKCHVITAEKLIDMLAPYKQAQKYDLNRLQKLSMSFKHTFFLSACSIILNMSEYTILLANVAQ